MTTHTFLLFFLATLGEWIEANIGTILAALGLGLSGLIFAIRLEGRVNRVCERVDAMEKEQDEQGRDMKIHTTDAEKHVNQLHMRGMEKRIDKIDARMDQFEITMSQGFEKTLSRIDTLLGRR